MTAGDLNAPLTSLLRRPARPTASAYRPVWFLPPEGNPAATLKFHGWQEGASCLVAPGPRFLGPV